MDKVELHLYPPLSYKMSPKRVGAYIKERNIDEGDTLEDLIRRLLDENREAWGNIVDVSTLEMRPGILVIHNGTALSWTEALSTHLSGGDQIAFRITYLGG